MSHDCRTFLDGGDDLGGSDHTVAIDVLEKNDVHR